MSEYRELLLGCGRDRSKKINPHYFAGYGRYGDFAEFDNLVTLDCDPDCKPDILMDLNRSVGLYSQLSEIVDPDAPYWEMLAVGSARQIRSDYFDEVHAYEVLEHLGALGDEQRFFADFGSIYRVLKPGGFLCATVPSRFSQWAFGDPGHKRVIPPCMLVFLDQTHYSRAVGTSTSSDYRHMYAGDFDIVMTQDDRETHRFVLQAIKPARMTS